MTARHASRRGVGDRPRRDRRCRPGTTSAPAWRLAVSSTSGVLAARLKPTSRSSTVALGARPQRGRPRGRGTWPSAATARPARPRLAPRPPNGAGTVRARRPRPRLARPSRPPRPPRLTGPASAGRDRHPLRGDRPGRSPQVALLRRVPRRRSSRGRGPPAWQPHRPPPARAKSGRASARRVGAGGAEGC